MFCNKDDLLKLVFSARKNNWLYFQGEMKDKNNGSF